MESQPLLAPSSDRPILIYWRLPGLSGQTFACISYRTPTGLELRAGIEGESPMLHAKVATHAAALQLAEAWRLQVARPWAA